jgi:hypothetical protein
MPTFASCYPAISFTDGGMPSEQPDPANGYYLPVEREASVGIAIRIANAHGVAAAEKHSKWKVLGVRQRRCSDSAEALINDAIVLLEFSAFGGTINVHGMDDVRPKGDTTYAAAGRFVWADDIRIAPGERYVAEDAVQIVMVDGGVAELQLNTMGCAYIILVPACINSASPGADAAAGTAAAIWDI